MSRNHSHQEKKHPAKQHPKKEEAARAPQAPKPAPGDKASVKMKFSENKFYNDLNSPIFEKDKVYLLEGADWIQRWLKRGGVVVEDESAPVEAKVDVPPPASDSVVGEPPKVEDNSDNKSEEPKQ